MHPKIKFSRDLTHGCQWIDCTATDATKGFPICSAATCGYTNSKVIVARSYVPVLTEALMDLEPGARRNAAFALGRMGHDAEPARKRLVACQGDEDETVRAEVVRPYSEDLFR